MSNTFFCYSDESGGYHQRMNKKQLNRHPFYTRGTLIINSKEWKYLNHNFLCLKQEFDIPLNFEIKWSDINLLKSNYKLKSRSFIKKYSPEHLFSFIEKSLELISTLKEKKIILSFTPNEIDFSWNEKIMLNKHLNYHLQRINNDLNIPPYEDISVFFMDPISDYLSNKENKKLSKFYNDLFLYGDEYIRNYSHIIDCVNFQDSNLSSGIQLSDFISGTFSSFLKYNPTISDSFEDGTKLFFKHIFPNVRISEDEYKTPFGYGIVDVYIDRMYKKWISDKINNTLEYLKK